MFSRAINGFPYSMIIYSNEGEKDMDVALVYTDVSEVANNLLISVLILPGVYELCSNPFRFWSKMEYLS